MSAFIEVPISHGENPEVILIATNVTQSADTAGTRHDALRRGRSIISIGVLPLGPTTLLKPRVTLLPWLMGPEWIVDHHDFTCMLPIDTAAAVMQDFYEDVAAYAATTMAPTSSGYRLSLGHILLEITAPPGIILNWMMVQNFALDMLGMTKRGYTNTYQVNFVHRPTGRMVTFSLYTGLLRGVTGGMS